MSRHRAAEAVTHPIAVGPLAPTRSGARHRSPGRSALRHGALAFGITGTALAALAPASLQVPDADTGASTASFALSAQGDELSGPTAPVLGPSATPTAASSDLRKATERVRGARAVSAVPAVSPGDPTADDGDSGGTGVDCGASGSYGGVKESVKKVGNAIECVWPGHEILGVGSRSNHSDHPGGYALDVMTADGDTIASCLTKNRDALGISYVIWDQRINTGRGWKGMADRGGDTANHKDHVHVSFERGASPDVSVLSSCG